jgi:hypothetical protein
MTRRMVGRVSSGTLARFLIAAVVATTAIGATSASSANRQTTRVTIFGDSAAEVLDYVSAAKTYLGTGLDMNWELRVCRRLVQLSCPYQGTRPPTVLDVVQAAPTGGLGPIVVIDVGYNDYVDQYQSDMETVLKALTAKGVQHVIWATLHEVRQDYRSINATIRAEAAKWPQVTIADWNAAAQGQSWFNPDGIHLNDAGAWGLARLLRPLILAACGDPCAPPPTHSAPRTYAITATVSAVRIGPFVAWKPPARGTYAQATTAFGSATSCRVLAGKKSRATWSSIGLTIQFIGAHETCQASGSAQLQILTATGPHWKTSKGLVVGDSLAKLERLYPSTKGHVGSYQLAKLDRSGSHALLTATVRSGRVARLSLAVRSGP